uniref:Sodium/calcium exchanger membrane region domain-containing protein n=1 Tax=Araucaria cunninghamii TaxID=56994 RepID=A0A0D6R718_ARACU
MASSLQHLLHEHKFFLKSSIILLFFVISLALYEKPWISGHGGRSRRVLTETLTHGSDSDNAAASPSPQCGTVSGLLPAERCSYARRYCGGGPRGPLFNYAALHYCYLREHTTLSVSILVITVVIQFYILATAAERHFSRVVARAAALLRLSPSMGGVTLLALGNGAPDVFASMAALRGDNARIGLGAILSAGTFVSAFVLGSVALTSAPFAVKPFPFVRDVFFYIMAATSLFYVYMIGVIFLWQAVGLVLFYLVFVAVVFSTDVGCAAEGKGGAPAETNGRGFHCAAGVEDECFDRKAIGRVSIQVAVNYAEETKAGSGCVLCRELTKFTQIWEVPVKLLLKLIIPSISSEEWRRFYASANIVLCPLVLLYFCNAFIPFHYPLVFLLPSIHFPLWMVVLAQSGCIGFAHYLIVDEPPDKEQKLSIIAAFVMSVCSISFVAGELLGCLAALGVILKLPPALLGLTVLAWGNSVGDLVADVAVAKAGQPAMAIAGCYAGPMFNMLIGLGLAFVVRTAHTYPSGYYLHFHISIVVAFCFLFMSLLGSLLVITWARFQVPRFWGFCLIALYILFVVMSLVIAKLM